MDKTLITYENTILPTGYISFIVLSDCSVLISVNFKPSELYIHTMTYLYKVFEMLFILRHSSDILYCGCHCFYHEYF